jgi:hypothetical protein
MDITGLISSLSPFVIVEPSDGESGSPVDNKAPVSFFTKSPEANFAGWNKQDVAIHISSFDNTRVSKIVCTVRGKSGTLTTDFNSDSCNFLVTEEGITTIEYYTEDIFGNKENLRQSTINIDKTPPVLSCTANPNMLWPPNHKFVSIQNSVQFSDPISGTNELIGGGKTKENDDTQESALEYYSSDVPAACSKTESRWNAGLRRLRSAAKVKRHFRIKAVSGSFQYYHIFSLKRFGLYGADL